MLPQRMFSATNSTSLMAIPLFILAGELMGFGGITEKLADMARTFVGHIKGGLAYVVVIVGAFLGALLGSANASAALLGRVLKPEMDKDDYDEVYSTCLCAAISILGPIIPPSMTFIIYGVTAQVSIGDMFFAGIIPGVLIALLFCMGIYYDSKHKRGENWPVSTKVLWKNRIISCVKAIPALLIPFIILGGILGGITTATESAAVASFVAFIVGAFVYRQLRMKDLPEIFERTAVTSAAIMIIVALANVLGWTMALDQIPQMIADSLLAITDNPYFLLLLINIFLIFVGMVMETFAAIIILVPVLLPVVTSLGVDPLHFGIIMCVNLTIGLLTPPVGIALFTTSSITKVPLNKMVGPVWRWVGIALVVLLLITYVPSLVTWLPYTFLH
ncbi:MAG TPA: C4-dicarboxylate ABC transporter permease [Clostridiales bacterium]|nr:C4-dicarboxylate ABC transporter permease [Clostridiales bacterium]